jgi:predicted transcriptional regulator of viral defense system
VKFTTDRPLADPDVAARKLLEIANATEPAQDARVYIEIINAAFLKAGGTPDQFRAALGRAIAKGWLDRHESGTYVKFTQAGADLFA